jgi:hypothetical protein
MYHALILRGVVNSQSNGVAIDVFNNYGIGTNAGSRADHDGSQDFRSRADVDVVPDPREAEAISGANSNLLENQAIYANPGIWVNHDAVRMGNQEPSANIAVEGNVGTRNSAPKPVANDEPFAQNHRGGAFTFAQALILADRPQELASGIPKPAGCFPRPIGGLGERAFVQGWALFDLGKPIVACLACFVPACIIKGMSLQIN